MIKIKHIPVLCLLWLAAGILWAQGSSPGGVYIDKDGVLRLQDTGGEASFYGTNYTLPFAHAYRAIHETGTNHKLAIDRDTYHFARLGLNAYRIHIWDVEISDGQGNLLSNEHLDLLDYLVARLKERGIYILMTAMTNFGNGYPEKNSDTGGFSYRYNKCDVHSDPQAIAAQERYLAQLVNHVNPYTGLRYKNDPGIAGFEVNNEPCHDKSPRQTGEYIGAMLSALGKAGSRKPVFYNVSHNMCHTGAYYSSSVQGTTYQWYPTGLVSGFTRKGNFLPSVDSYTIPFSDMKDFSKKAKAVYEYDPADVMYSHLYSAMTRSFRSQGFQWITQFAYDPLDIAWANTEYRTHFLNLAYTPNKALGMKIAAEAAYRLPRGKEYPKYPADTLFGDFRVSYFSDLSELNSPGAFYYSNNTASVPVSPDRLLSVAGCGSSPVVTYEGTGAYFLDRLEEGLWRLEVMPDALLLEDPFAVTSLKKEVATVLYNRWEMDIRLPGLEEGYTVQGINRGNNYKGTAAGTNIKIVPGAYLLKNKGMGDVSSLWNAGTRWKNITLGEFVAPESRLKAISVVHRPVKTAERDLPLVIQAQVAGPVFPDSVLVCLQRPTRPGRNPYIRMERTGGYTYRAEIPSQAVTTDVLRYHIVVCGQGKTVTFPAGVEGRPTDWDYYADTYYRTEVVTPETPVELLSVNSEDNRPLETYAIPATARIEWRGVIHDFAAGHRLAFGLKTNEGQSRFFWRKYIKDEVSCRMKRLEAAGNLCLVIKNAGGIASLDAGFITSQGITYTASFVPDTSGGVVRIPLSALRQGKTTILPAPYPTFLERYFVPDTQIPFGIRDIEILEISAGNGRDASLEIGDIWME
ncbi:hypothetical protein IR083_00850 [Dysgonomonas sp. GY75]|uniref:hypothetical protein n=1 Tax=Dysgonomonas sp. GY75 TaxID=2780419 RepID=UPI001883B003|nr:hypothetical protein [Dysgonomonas sp. GY75]MBF0647367.1 hypothetical protein [Dysgonomonas sp. GY75]